MAGHTRHFAYGKKEEKKEESVGSGYGADGKADF